MIGATMSLNEIIATFARVLARNVHYQEISDEEWRRNAASRNYNPHAIEQFRTDFSDLAFERYTPGPDLEESTRRRLANAEAMIGHAIELQPQEPDYHYGLGLVFERQCDLNAALDALRAEMVIKPDQRGVPEEISEIEGRLRNGSAGASQSPDTLAEPEFHDAD